MLLYLRSNPLRLFMLRLFIIVLLSSIVSIVAIYFYNEYKIAKSIKLVIKKEITSFKAEKSVKLNLQYISDKVKKREDIVFFELYDNSLKDVLDIKKEEFNFLLKEIIEQLKDSQPDREYYLIPVNDDDVYLYFPSQITIHGHMYYMNMLVRLNNKTLIQIYGDIQTTIMTIILTILVVFFAIFPIIYTQYKKLLDEKQLLLQSNIETLISLGNAIAQRDSETGDHNYRVTYYSIKLAQQLELSREQIQSLIKGAFLHDIGKIGISDMILLKPSKLTEEEFEEMKTHVTKGGGIVANNHWLNNDKDVILCHHEKFDGSGYPHGLKGEEIPYNARIFAVVDVFDALTSKRPYKEAFTVDASMKIIQGNINSHFDQTIVEAFEKIYKQVYFDVEHVDSKRLKETFYKSLKPYFNVDFEA